VWVNFTLLPALPALAALQRAKSKSAVAQSASGQSDSRTVTSHEADLRVSVALAYHLCRAPSFAYSAGILIQRSLLVKIVECVLWWHGLTTVREVVTAE
jgi:hypothetical protein